MAAAGAVIAIASVVGALTSVVSTSQSAQSQQFQEQGVQAEWQSKIDTAKYNIERSKEEARILTGDIQREGALFQRGQMAAMGASGAEVGSGTPLMNMLQTQAGIARDVLNVQRASQMEIEYLESEIELYESYLTPKGSGPRPEMDMQKPELFIAG